ncbi:MAG: hydroxymethylglutaryl-CoA reductase, degradative [Chloroflexota bacterium]
MSEQLMTTTTLPKTSRLEGFYKQSLADRARLVAEWADLDQTDYQALQDGGLSLQLADNLIENAIGLYSLPLGIATNFVVNGKEHLIPMVIEEPSVVAACSFAAKLARAGGGFTAWADEPIMIAQIQTLNITDVDAAAEKILAHKDELLCQANAVHPNLVARGGGARDIEARVVRESAIGPMLIVHLLVDVRDAMGANIVNTAAEALAPTIEALTGGRVLLRILSNLTDRRMAGARCAIPFAALTTDALDGVTVAEGVIAAWAMADADPYRAATHNKGAMNGVDAVLLATGNDWRAIEAGAHAYAARNGRYASLTKWCVENPKSSPRADVARGIIPNPNLTTQPPDHTTTESYLVGKIALPMALGTVGGTTKAHPAARAALKILGVQSAQELAGIIAAVGLAQNFSAIRALATEGIQKGHMRLHARKLAVNGEQ